MSTDLSRERLLDAIEAQAGLVRFALEGAGGEGADLSSPVAACPGWTVHELVAHLGTANWWGGANVREANPEVRARGMRAVMESAPAATEGADALARWYAGLAEGAIETYAETEPDAPVWTFAGPGRADYWLRRQLHETAVHRWDLECALSGEAGTTPLMDDVALDTIDEFCTALRPIMSAALPPLPVTIRVRAGEREWVLPGAEGEDGQAAPEVELTGPPETLALLLWGRVGPDAEGLEVTGDRGGLDAALEAGLSI
ncbi:maleylpyruvate isomerase family mycothiol-dependent enzyme [Dietzia sp. NPDC055877]